MASDMGCETRAYLKYALKKEMKGGSEEKSAMVAGSLVHEWLEKWMAETWEQNPHETLRHLYDAHFPEPPSEERLSFLNISRVLGRVYELRDTWPWVGVLQTESLFDISLGPIASEIHVFGRIDGVVQMGDGSVYALEHKTTGSIDDLWRNQWRTSAQLIGYWWATQQLYPECQVRGVLVNAIELSKLPPYDGNMEKKCSKHSVKYKECQFRHVKQEILGPFSFNRHHLDAWHGTMIAYAEKLQDMGTYELKQGMYHMAQEGMFTYTNRSNLCAACQFQPFCFTLGRNPNAVAQVMQNRAHHIDAESICRERPQVYTHKAYGYLNGE